MRWQKTTEWQLNTQWAGIQEDHGEAPALIQEAAPSTPEMKMSPELLWFQVNPEIGMH